jgi:DNA-binding response OmpR family regulator
VFMTGDILSPETLETLEQSGTQVLSKPFSIEQLTHMMRTVAQRRAVNSHRG